MFSRVAERISTFEKSISSPSDGEDITGFNVQYPLSPDGEDIIPFELKKV